MGHPHEHLERVGDAGPRGDPGELSDEADAAGILVVGRVVESPGGRGGVVARLDDDDEGVAASWGAAVERAPGAGGGGGVVGGEGRGAELGGFFVFLFLEKEAKFFLG